MGLGLLACRTVTISLGSVDRFGLCGPVLDLVHKMLPKNQLRGSLIGMEGRSKSIEVSPLLSLTDQFGLLLADRSLRLATNISF